MTQPTPNDKECHCNHRLTGTGAVFYQSTGWLVCTVCRGWARIRKPIFQTNGTISAPVNRYDGGTINGKE